MTGPISAETGKFAADGVAVGKDRVPVAGAGVDGSAPEGGAVFDLSQMTKKKKKKKATPATTAPVEPESTLPAIGDMSLEEGTGEEEVIDFPAPDFSKPKKKWRKAKIIFDTEDDGASRVVSHTHEKQPWDGTDRDYTYNELVLRAFQFLYGKGSSGGRRTGGKKKISLPLPVVAREGTKKTVFMNFGSTCKQIHRQPDHLLQYIGSELGTTGNIQDGGRLVLKGRFSAEAILKVLKAYMMEYVICTSCKSPDTVLMRDANTRLYFVSCESCGAKRSVAAITFGFRAQTDRRKRT